MVPWGEEQDKARCVAYRGAHVATYPRATEFGSAIPSDTGSRQLGAGSALTHVVRGTERAIGFASHRWSTADAKSSATEREVMAVLWAIQQHRPYLWGRKFFLITDCPAFLW